jgi:SAM-dependent methyltransferase
MLPRISTASAYVLRDAVRVDARSERNRMAWDVAARKYVEESDDLLGTAQAGSSLLASERELLQPILQTADVVVHLQSGHGLDDLDLARAGDGTVVGVDFSEVTASAAKHRAEEMDLNVRYVLSECTRAGLRGNVADLVYTGKGALMWLPDLNAWATEVARLLRPGGHLFLHEAHPAACLWTRDIDHPRIEPSRSYFAETRVNDTFPASAIDHFAPGAQLDAVEWQWTFADILNAVTTAGLELRHLGEYPEPFWRPTGQAIPAWTGRLPNSFSLLARLVP